MHSFGEMPVIVKKNHLREEDDKDGEEDGIADVDFIDEDGD